MGFEVLAGLKQQLAEQAKQQKQEKTRARERRKQEPKTAPDPALLAIARLQRHYPDAFPKKPAPKKPLKVGILKDLQADASHGLDEEALRLALSTWCQGWRYWDCLKTGNARVDLAGASAGEVTAAEAQRARQLSYRHRQSKKPRPADTNTGDAKPAS